MAVKASRIRDNGEEDPDAEAKDAYEAQLYRLLRARLNGQLDEVLAVLGDPPDLNKLTDEFWRTREGELLADLRPRIERMALEAIASAGLAVPVLWDEVVIAREAAEWASRYSYELVRELTDNSREWLRRKVPQFIETPGMTTGQLRQELAPAFGERRAQSIAVTETTRAYAQGGRMVQEALRRGGVEMERIWNTSGDERVCDICGPLDGVPERDWGLHSDGPPAHPNCRCWVTLRSKRAS